METQALKTRTKIQVKDLRAGDDLGNCKIIASSYYGNYCGTKDSYLVKVEYPCGGESTRFWGKHTTVTVVNR